MTAESDVKSLLQDIVQVVDDELASFNLTERYSPSNLQREDDTSSCEIASHELVGRSPDNAHNNYFKGCKWSPDGLCFITNNNNSCLQLWNTPPGLLLKTKIDKKQWALQDCVRVKEPEIVYDFSWWPLMNSRDPVTCCFASCSKDQPVHLWDAFDGSLRASYIALDNVQEIQSAYSLCFSSDGQQLICGYKKEVCLFYVDRPGNTCEKWNTLKRKPYKSGQSGIISCLEFNSNATMFACGSYDKTVALYSARNGSRLELNSAHAAGVTCLKFSNDGNHLYTGARKDGSIKCWDLRSFQTPLFVAKRPVATNQRIFFDFVANKKSETHLVSGSTDGTILFWDLQELKNTICTDIPWDTSTEIKTPECYSFKAHNDCANGCSWHPYLPLLATTSGQRHFTCPSYSDSENETSSNEIFKENCVKLWKIHLTQRSAS